MNKLSFVDASDLYTSLSSLYHESSKHSPFEGLSFQTEERQEQLKKFLKTIANKSKHYSHAPKVLLTPLKWNEIKAELGPLLHNRATRREFKNQIIDKRTISTLLARGIGINRKQTIPWLRTYPSGGALFPLEVYIALFDNSEIRNGFYHFYVKKNCLSLLKQGNCRKFMQQFFIQPEIINNSNAVIIITANFMRSFFKYEKLAYRLTLLEAGHLAQNLILMGEALGLSSVPVCGFLERKMEKFMKIDGIEESTLYALVIGHAK